MTLSGRTHHCAAGETFDSVALQEYGDEKYACDLLAANPSHCLKTVFTGGEILSLPVVTVPENDRSGENGNYISVTAPWKE